MPSNLEANPRTPLPTVLFPPGHGGRATRRSSISQRVARMWQMLLLALAAAALTGFLWQALA